MTISLTYNVATSLFGNGLAYTFIDSSSNSSVYIVAIGTGLDAPVDIYLSQGNSDDRQTTETVLISTTNIPTNAAYDEYINTYYGDYGKVSVGNLTATTGTLKIKIKWQ